MERERQKVTIGERWKQIWRKGRMEKQIKGEKDANDRWKEMVE